MSLVADLRQSDAKNVGKGRELAENENLCAGLGGLAQQARKGRGPNFGTETLMPIKRMKTKSKKKS